MRPLRALLRQRIFFVWQRSELLARIHSHQLAHNRTPPKQTRRVREHLGRTTPGRRRASLAPIGSQK